MATRRMRRWLRVGRLWDTVCTLWETRLSTLPDDYAELFGNEPGRKPSPLKVKPELELYEPRFYPGQTMGMLGVGSVGTGLAMLDRAVTRPEVAPAPHVVYQTSSLQGALRGAAVAASAEIGRVQAPAQPQFYAAGPMVGAAGVGDSQAGGSPGVSLEDDGLGDVLVDPLTGASLRAPSMPPTGGGSLDLGGGGTTQGGGQGMTAPSSTGFPGAALATADATGTNNTPFLPMTPSGNWASMGQLAGGGVTPGGIVGYANYGKGNHPAAWHSKHDPLWVLDANKGIVVTPGTPDNEFSNWSMDLRAQVSGATVNTYSWNLSSAPDATSVSGSSTYNLTFTWANFSGAARTDTISVTETPVGGGTALSQTLTFVVASTSSPAYTASAVTTASTWPAVVSPDSILPDQETVSGGQFYTDALGANCGCAVMNEAPHHEPDYRIGLVTGELQTAAHIHSYNPGVPAMHLVYSSAAAEAKPIFVVHYKLDPSQAVPNRISAQLTFNGGAGQTYYWNTSTLNPGDTMELALQADATGLSTGRYSYSISVVANYSTPATTTYSGNVDVVNESGSLFGPGWTFDQVQKLFPVTGGVIIEVAGGTSLWFANGGTSGTFTTPAGDFSTLTQNTGTGVYTRTMKDGTVYTFDSTGKQTSWADRNGSTFTDGYDGSGRLNTITDPYGLVSTIAYNGSGMASSITDGASRTVNLGYDTSNRLATVTDVDGDVTSYGYDAASGRIATITTPRSYTFTATYNGAGRVSSVARPDGTSDQFTALQMQGIAISTPGLQVIQTKIAASNSVSFTATTSGNFLIAVWGGMAVSGFAAPTTPSGWTLRSSSSDSGRGVYVYERQNAPSISSLTFSGQTVDNQAAYFLEAGGVMTSGAFDVSATNSGTGTSLTSGTTATTAQASELVVAGFDMSRTNASGTGIGNFTSPTNGFAIDKQVEASFVGDVFEYLHLAGLYKLVSATGTQSTGVTATPSQPWKGAVDAYKMSTSNTTGTQGNPFSPTLAVQAQASYTDPRSNTWKIGFDWLGFGHETQNTDPLGNLVNSCVDANGLTWLVADQLGNRTRAFFDSSGNPTKVVQPDDTTRQYSYNSFAEVTQFTDEASNLTTYTYDSHGNRTTQKDALNHVTTYTYNSQGFILTKTDALNHITSYGYDSRNRETTETNALGGVLTMTYDSASHMLTRQDQRGFVTTFAYDSHGQVLNEWLPDSNPANHPVLTYTYDAAENRVTAVDALGNVTTSAYDALNRLVTVTDPLNHVTSFAYDGNSNRTKVTDPLGRVTSYTFDAANRQTGMTDPAGNITTFTLDAAGRKTANADALNLLTTFSYTSRDQVSVKTDALSNLSTYSYSATGNTTAVTMTSAHSGGGGGGGGGMMGPSGGGPGVSPAGSGGTGFAGPDGGSDLNWTYSYDALNRKVTATDPLNHVVTYGYDAVGNKTTITDRLGHVVTSTYDALNRLVSLKDALGNVTSFGYDAAGNKVTVTDPLGRVTSYGYDAQNRLVTVTDPRGGVVSYGYDLAGRQVTITDPVGNITSYSYDAAGRLTQTQDALGTATVAYDNAGQKTGETDRDGRRKAFTYDNAGRKLTEQWLDGSGNVTRPMTCTYNADGWLKTEQDPDSKYSFWYDGLGNLAVVDNLGTPSAPRLVLTYTYDGFGNKTNLQDSYSGLLTYSYDAAQNLTAVTMTVNGTQGPQATMAYDNGQRMTGVTRFVTSGGNKVTEALAYDNADRLATITYSHTTAGALATFAYGYDAASQLTNYNGPEGALTYTYDATGQLTGVGGARSEAFSYDLNGNRTMTGYSTSSGNRLMADGTYTYAYDSEGNQTGRTRTSDGEQWAFTWDYRNRMTQAVEKTSGGVTVTNDLFIYDGEDRRIGKSTNGTQVWFGYDLKNSYIDFSGAGGVTMRYEQMLGLDSMLARFDGTNAGFYLTDNIGSVRLLVNTAGTVLDQLSYYGFGGVQTETNSASGDRFKFADGETDTEISLQHDGERYYAPASGRWLSIDPLGFVAHDTNLYRYVNNDPVALADPTGELPTRPLVVYYDPSPRLPDPVPGPQDPCIAILAKINDAKNLLKTDQSNLADALKKLKRDSDAQMPQFVIDGDKDAIKQILGLIAGVLQYINVLDQDYLTCLVQHPVWKAYLTPPAVETRA